LPIADETPAEASTAVASNSAIDKRPAANTPSSRPTRTSPVSPASTPGMASASVLSSARRRPLAIADGTG